MSANEDWRPWEILYENPKTGVRITEPMRLMTEEQKEERRERLSQLSKEFRRDLKGEV